MAKQTQPATQKNNSPKVEEIQKIIEELQEYQSSLTFREITIQDQAIKEHKFINVFTDLWHDSIIDLQDSIEAGKVQIVPVSGVVQ